MLSTEEKERAILEQCGVRRSVHLTNERDLRYECVKCRHICYISGVICPCPMAARKVACLRHAQYLCFCPPDFKLHVSWYTNEELGRLAAATRGLLTGVAH